MTRKIVLASASPRRKELLAQICDDFETIALKIDEESRYRRPHLIVQDLARQKTGDLPARYPDRIVIGADTVVWHGGKIYGKPRDEETAKRYLRELSGRRHSVYTGVCVCLGDYRNVFYERSDVIFRKLSDADIDAYVRDKKPLDKAGAYGIQDGETVERYRGDYDNIVGLPTRRLKEVLEQTEILYDER